MTAAIACPVCGGAGRIRARSTEQPWAWAMTIPCPHCAGRGRVAAESVLERTAVTALVAGIAVLLAVVMAAQLLLAVTR